MKARLSRFAVALLLVACEKEPEPTTEGATQAQEVILQVRTLDKTGAPVEMVRFYINGKKFGITDQDGAFKGRYPAKDGELLTFNVEAPAGYSVPANIDQSRWRHQVKYPAGGRPLQLNFTATLQRPERDYLFMVNAKSPATPVTVNGKAVGKTGSGGEVLLLVRGEPGAKFAARAGSVILNGEFAEDEEVYLLTSVRQGPVGGAPVAAEAEPAAPDSVAAESGAAPDSAAPESLAAAETVAAPETAAAPETQAVAVATEPEVPAAPETVAVAIAPETAAPRRQPPIEVAVADPPPPDPFERVAGPRAERQAPATAAPRRPPVVEDEPVAKRPRVDPEPVVDVFVEPPPREPDPEPIEIKPAAQPKDDGLGIILEDDPPAAPVTDAPARVEAPVGSKAQKLREEGQLGDKLIDDGDTEVAPDAKDRKATVGGDTGPAASGMGREEISQRLEGISAGLAQSGVLKKADVDFLGQVDRTHPGYYEANRLLAEFYYQLKDYKRQSEALEIATTQGRYKHDPTILLSLAKAYALRKNYGKALGTMRRVEEKMRNLPAAKKADAFRFYAEILEFEYMRQADEDAKGANTTLVDKAIEKWERYRTFNQGADPGGVQKAEKKIKELQELKLKVEP